MADEQITSPLSSQSQDQGTSATSAAQDAGSTQTQSSQAGTTASTSSQTQSAAEKPARPAWVSNEKFWDADKGELKSEDFSKYLTDMESRIAADDVRRGSLPQNPEAYKIELPADFKLPEGQKFEFEANDPVLAQARTWAHASGLTQDQFSQALSLFAGAKVAEQAQVSTAREAELAKLGTTAATRVDAVLRWMQSVDGSSDKNDAKALASMLVTARHVEAFERLITRFSNQGGASFTQQHRDHSPATVSDEQWARMSYGEKKAYADKHSTKAA